MSKVPFFLELFLPSCILTPNEVYGIEAIMNEMSNMSSGYSGNRAQRGAADPNSLISQKLRDFYDNVREERIPDRFLDLLEQLDRAEQAANPETRSAGEE